MSLRPLTALTPPPSFSAKAGDPEIQVVKNASGPHRRIYIRRSIRKGGLEVNLFC